MLLCTDGSQSPKLIIAALKEGMSELQASNRHQHL
jgi:hypothetical protein